MDRRVKYTKSIIKDTFLNLLGEKDISNITVTEVCKIADINRATFYRYYEDCYDLLKKIESEFMDELSNSPPMINLPDESVYDFTYGVLKVFENNKKLIRLLFNTNNNVYFLNEVLEYCYNKCVDKWSRLFPDINKNIIEYKTVYIFNGALGVINYWIKNDFSDDVSFVATMIEEATINGIKQFITTKK